MNRQQRARFDRFFDDRYDAIVAALDRAYPGEGARRAHSSLATAYRFWGKVELDGDPEFWVLRDASAPGPTVECRVAAPPVAAPPVADPPVADPPVDASAPDHRDDLDRERKLVVRAARWRRAAASVVLSALALVLIAAELFAAGR